MLNWLAKIVRPPKRNGKADDFWKSYRERLATLHASFFTEDCVNSAAEEDIAAILIDAKTDPAAHFEKLYAVEQRLFLLAPEHFVEAEAQRRFAEAEFREIPAREALKAQYQKSKTLDEKRAVLHGLVDEIQLFYLNRSLDRRARREASDRLNFLSRIIMIPTVLILLAIYLVPHIPGLGSLLVGSRTEASGGYHTLEFVADYHLLAIMWFGLIGAYFSRLISFQQKAITLGREDIETEFSGKTLAIRITIGICAAIIMYVLLRANMVAGSLFPNWDDFRFVESTRVTKAGRETVAGLSEAREITARTFGIPDEAAAIPASEVRERAPATLALISVDFAQLLVWSLLAGFSERLIPDRFASLDKRAASGNCA